MLLQVSSITLTQYKNYFHEEFSFYAPVVGICGRNGVGKTNLLDAIQYLCFTKSYFSRTDVQVIQQGHQGFRIEGAVQYGNETEKVVCVLRENGRKEFSLNDVPYTRFSQHIGRYPCVVIAPDDVQLVIGPPEERRRFLDTLLSQLDAQYLQHLIRFNKILQQRNSFLRHYREGLGSSDLSVLDVLDGQLAADGAAIGTKRQQFLLQFLPQVTAAYAEIAQRFEPVRILYDSELIEHDLAALLAQNRNKDLLLQRTTAGPHRDDLLFMMGEQPFKNIASQGQRKSLLFALKLSELNTLQAQKQVRPILLLDDVFEKLDEERITNLLHTVTAEKGQVFITDTSCSRLQSKIEALNQPFQIISL